MILRCLALLIVLAGCSSRPPEDPGTVFQNARQEFRLGKSSEPLVAELDRALAQWPHESEPTWHWRFLLLKSDILAASGKPDEALKLLEGRAPTGAAAAELTALQRMNQGWAKLRLAEFEEAKRLLDEAYQLGLKLGSPALLAEIQTRRAVTLTKLNDPAAAEASLTGALEYARRAADPYLEISVLGNFGFSRLDSSRYDEAIPWFEQVLPLAKKGGYGLQAARTLHNLGICYYRLGDLDKALKLLSQAKQAYVQASYGPGLQNCLGDMGNVYYYQGDLKTALACYREALRLAREFNNRDWIVRWLINLAITAIEAQESAEAEDFNRQALELLAGMPGDRSRAYAVLNSARIAAARDQFQEAERIYREAIEQAETLGESPVLLEANARLGSLFIRTGQRGKAERQLRSVVSVIETTRSKLARDQWKLTFQSSVIPFYEDYVDLLMDRGQTGRALEIAESCRARLLTEKLGMRDRPLMSTVAGHQAKARAQRAVLLAYWLAPKRSFLWVITSKGVTPITLPPEKEIGRLVEAYTNVILNLEDLRESGNPLGQRLYEMLLAKAEGLVPPGSNVVVVPDGPLHELNFETLLVGGDRPRYWIEDVTVAIAPSLGVVPAGSPKPASRGKNLLLIGNPRPPTAEFPPLPDVETEMRNLEEGFEPKEKKVLAGALAQPGSYREAVPGRFSLIHFSAHAVANRESPLDSAIILSGAPDSYKLYARDVAEVPLRAELVTISACRSAGARLYSGEGLVGFSWAFLQAGARNVIAGLWDVNDRSTAVLMSRLYQELGSGKAPAEALRAAKLAFLKEPTYGRPYHWAPFELFTRGTPFQGEIQTAGR